MYVAGIILVGLVSLDIVSISIVRVLFFFYRGEIFWGFVVYKIYFVFFFWIYSLEFKFNIW